jgi:putative ABC transport system ATP-binding protein
MRTKIEAEAVTVWAGGKEILHQVTTSIPEKRIFTIVGPSGAGKSTFLRTINRLVETRSGEIRLDGKSVKEMEPVTLRKKVGMVFQIPLAFEGTVEENLLIGPRLNSMEPPDVSELMDMVGLSRSFLKRKANELSVGEQQRMCIGRAIANRPEVLLLDEPTASLDPDSARVVEDLILELKEIGQLTLVVVTHNVEQGKRIGDWTMLMNEGRSMRTMPSHEFYESYKIGGKV